MTPTMLCLVALVGRIGPMYSSVMPPTRIMWGVRWTTSASMFDAEALGGGFIGNHHEAASASRLRRGPVEDQWTYAVHASHWMWT